MSSEKSVLYDVQDHVATITMNRPQRRNAMNEVLLRDLQVAFEQAAHEEATRAIVLTGAGRSFCAGADLAGFAQKPTADEVYDFIIKTYQPLMGQIVEIQKPVIAAINGAAAGAGASLALACDLRIMADDGAFMMAFSNVGLVPDAGATWFLVRLIGYSRAYEMAAEGQRLPAQRSMAWGLTNKVVPAADLMDEALAWGRRLAKRPTLALGLTKEALNYAAHNDLMSTIEYEARLQKQTIPSHDHMEGVMAFAQRREPQFEGK